MEDRKLSWEQIKEHYPDEWVIIVDYEEDPVDIVAAGRILDHSKSRDEIHQRQLSLEQDAAVVYTGEPTGNVVMGLSPVRSEP